MVRPLVAVREFAKMYVSLAVDDIGIEIGSWLTVYTFPFTVRMLPFMPIVLTASNVTMVLETKSITTFAE